MFENCALRSYHFPFSIPPKAVDGVLGAEPLGEGVAEDQTEGGAARL